MSANLVSPSSASTEWVTLSRMYAVDFALSLAAQNLEAPDSLNP